MCIGDSRSHIKFYISSLTDLTDLTDLYFLPLESTSHPELNQPTYRTESRDAIASKNL